MAYLFLHSGQLSAKRLAKRLMDCTAVEQLDPSSSRDVIIRWGSMNGTDRSKIVLNSRRALQNVENRRQMLLMLRGAGLRTPLAAGATGEGEAKETRLRLTRHYRVPIFNLRALSLFRADGNTVWIDRRVSRVQDSFQEVSMSEDHYALRMTKLAVRAVHTVGLDFGLVSLGVTPKGFGYVLDIEPAPALTPRLMDLYANALTEWVNHQDQSQEINYTMGTDLEFMLKNRQGAMVLASKYFPRKGPVGCDDRSINRDKKRLPLAEVRPEPAASPLELFDHLKKVMEDANQMINNPNIEWLAGSMPFQGYSVGGHIHFKGIPLTGRLVRAFDHYLGFPIMMIENSETACKRRPKYGFLGDIRVKDHGGFEYRTPGSWLVTPEIARAVLCLADVVVRNEESFSRDFFLEREVQAAFYSGDKWKLRGLFFDIWNEIADTDTFHEYADYLSIIPKMVTQGLEWNEEVDIRSTWKLPISKSRGKRALAR